MRVAIAATGQSPVAAVEWLPASAS